MTDLCLVCGKQHEVCVVCPNTGSTLDESLSCLGCADKERRIVALQDEVARLSERLTQLQVDDGPDFA